MKGLNEVRLIGNAGGSPTVRATNSGPVANLSIATNMKWKDASGDWKERTEWHQLVGFGFYAEMMRDQVKKGTPLYVEGRLQTDSWDQDGEKRSKTVVIVERLELMAEAPKAQK